MNGGAKHYLAYDPRTIIHLGLLSVFIVGLPYAVSKYYGGILLQFLRVPMIILAVLLVSCMINILQIVRIDDCGISLFGFMRKKKSILWEDVVCCGYFFHYTYKDRKRKFFYFSTKPLPGGVNYLNLTTMAKQTDTFLYMAEQRDVESMIKQFYPSFMRK